jgi:hypothetical protein
MSRWRRALARHLSLFDEDRAMPLIIRRSPKTRRMIVAGFVTL